MRLTVRNPEIEEVLDLETGECVPAEQLIGSEWDKAIQLRMKLRTGIKQQTPQYVCPICGVPVYLVSLVKHHSLFFRHLVEDGRCTAITRGQLSQKEINAIKYNGAKESALHIRMKEQVAACLRADPRFHDVHMEQRWDNKLTVEWRRPDVQACLGEQRIAFEIQLSTTYLDVIAERRLFYLNEDALLVWIFAKFDAGSRRLTQEDVFFNNNQNAFVVSDQTTAVSKESSTFMLEAIWAKPTPDGGSSGLHRKVVSFHDLTLDINSQQAYYFDFYGTRAQMAKDEETFLVTLRNDFEAYWTAATEDEDVTGRLAAWRSLRNRFRAVGHQLPEYPNHPPRHLLNTLYSAKFGRPVGWNFKTFLEVAHWVAASKTHQPNLQYFRKALKVFGHGYDLQANDKTGKWAEKVSTYKAAIKAGSSAYDCDHSHDALVAFLFPEMDILPA